MPGAFDNVPPELPDCIVEQDAGEAVIQVNGPVGMIISAALGRSRSTNSRQRVRISNFFILSHARLSQAHRNRTLRLSVISRLIRLLLRGAALIGCPYSIQWPRLCPARSKAQIFWPVKSCFDSPKWMVSGQPCTSRAKTDANMTVTFSID